MHQAKSSLYIYLFVLRSHCTPLNPRFLLAVCCEDFFFLFFAIVDHPDHMVIVTALGIYDL